MYVIGGGCVYLAGSECQEEVLVGYAAAGLSHAQRSHGLGQDVGALRGCVGVVYIA